MNLGQFQNRVFVTQFDCTVKIVYNHCFFFFQCKSLALIERYGIFTFSGLSRAFHVTFGSLQVLCVPISTKNSIR